MGFGYGFRKTSYVDASPSMATAYWSGIRAACGLVARFRETDCVDASPTVAMT